MTDSLTPSHPQSFFFLTSCVVSLFPFLFLDKDGPNLPTSLRVGSLFGEFFQYPSHFFIEKKSRKISLHGSFPIGLVESSIFPYCFELYLHDET